MKRQFWLTLTATSLLIAGAADAKLYKWVDEDGVVHYGDALPQARVGKHHEELLSSGVTSREVERTKTREEIEAELAATQAEQAKDELIRRREAEQARKDQILLETFTTERDIILIRDSRLGALESNISITEGYNKQLQDQLDSTQIQIDNLERGKREVPENLLKKLDNTRNQLEKNVHYIKTKKNERKLIEEQFEEDLSRFRELKEAERQRREAYDQQRELLTQQRSLEP